MKTAKNTRYKVVLKVDPVDPTSSTNQTHVVIIGAVNEREVRQKVMSGCAEAAMQAIRQAWEGHPEIHEGFQRWADDKYDGNLALLLASIAKDEINRTRIISITKL